FPSVVECAGASCGKHHNARRWAGVIRLNSQLKNTSAVIGAGCNARNVRAIKADIGQFAIAELGQFADIALIVPERLDHADEREQHGVVSLHLRFSSWRSLTVEMNIDQNPLFQKTKWCGAASHIMHGIGKK